MCPEKEQLTEASFTRKCDLKLIMAKGRAAQKTGLSFHLYFNALRGGNDGTTGGEHQVVTKVD